MKKTILLFSLLITLISYSQNDNDFYDFSAFAHVGNSFGLGVQIDQPTNMGFVSSLKSARIGYPITNNITDTTIIGDGFEIGLGTVIYFNEEENKGFYIADYINYGSIKFDDDLYSGKYQYVGILNPEVGYKFLIGGKFIINLQVSGLYKLEIKGKDDVNNKSFDNYTKRVGLAFGYRF